MTKAIFLSLRGMWRRSNLLERMGLLRLPARVKTSLKNLSWGLVILAILLLYHILYFANPEDLFHDVCVGPCPSMCVCG